MTTATARLFDYIFNWEEADYEAGAYVSYTYTLECVPLLSEDALNQIAQLVLKDAVEPQNLTISANPHRSEEQVYENYEF